MTNHSKTLFETKLWQLYTDKTSEHDRIAWMERVYNAAVNALKDVRETFGNYTLHDETHVLNVIDAMGGLLGNQAINLTVGELELLILSACLHDLGMVYTEDERNECLRGTDPGDKNKRRRFLEKNAPELLGRPADEWGEDKRQWFLRSLHPFRIDEVLDNNKAWVNIFDDIPSMMPDRDTIIEVCKAHGEDRETIKKNERLEYTASEDIDPLFCAMLLRLADLLDFDDTRAPEVLYRHVVNNEKSRKEWDKHRASMGFNYHDEPSTVRLPYRARCESPGIEHTIRDFLNWVDDELSGCAGLQKLCEKDWQRNFPFPYAVDRKGIKSTGYSSGDFKLTMDQEQILALLTGENLYDSNFVFVRELLQNAIDATLLRAKMDQSFSLENARIDFWEWTDEKGNIWFRVDDRGTGMTQGMLQRYFLKVGNSYYNSKELMRDLHDHGQSTEYKGISRFGIGFLSCFLCGDYAEVSTRYFDDEKNKLELDEGNGKSVDGYGLRLQITGLTGYYTLKSQAEKHSVEGSLPAPFFGHDVIKELDCSKHYRSEPGTSITVRLNPGKLGAANLRKELEEWLSLPKFPVYYNGEKVGTTYQEFMDEVHKLDGTTLHDLTDEAKREFDKRFPEVAGNYPKLSMFTLPLDKKENNCLFPEMSGAIFKFDLQFEKPLIWSKDGHAGEIKRSEFYGERFDLSDGKEILRIEIARDCKIPDIMKESRISNALYYTYNCVRCGAAHTKFCSGIAILSDPLRPNVNANRNRIKNIPTEVTLILSALGITYGFLLHSNIDDLSINEWRKLRTPEMNLWITERLRNNYEQYIDWLKNGNSLNIFGVNLLVYDFQRITHAYYDAYLQDIYNMTVNYYEDRTPTISFEEKESSGIDDRYDLLPPMLFCNAGNSESRQYLCCASLNDRYAITSDHPYAKWLIDHSRVLNKHFLRHFEQIIYRLRNWCAEDIIEGCNKIREQLIDLAGRQGIYIGNIPELSERDFWYLSW
ncbi:MAG: ATP-binding protein [Christensenellaceae bacterium]|nr:ATP-binding protein [Christensenellaceae bacterium]